LASPVTGAFARRAATYAGSSVALVAFCGAPSGTADTPFQTQATTARTMEVRITMTRRVMTGGFGSDSRLKGHTPRCKRCLHISCDARKHGRQTRGHDTSGWGPKGKPEAIHNDRSHGSTHREVAGNHGCPYTRLWDPPGGDVERGSGSISAFVRSWYTTGLCDNHEHVATG
jgi:hypothetical protein